MAVAVAVAGEAAAVPIGCCGTTTSTTTGTSTWANSSSCSRRLIGLCESSGRLLRPDEGVQRGQPRVAVRARGRVGSEVPTVRLRHGALLRYYLLEHGLLFHHE